MGIILEQGIIGVSIKGNPTMDREIKRLLQLARIPGFRLSAKETIRLEEWKKAQEPVKIIKPKRTYTHRKKTEKRVEELKDTGEIETSTNEVKDEFKTLNEE